MEGGGEGINLQGAAQHGSQVSPTGAECLVLDSIRHGASSRWHIQVWGAHGTFEQRCPVQVGQIGLELRKEGKS